MGVYKLRKRREVSSGIWGEKDTCQKKKGSIMHLERNSNLTVKTQIKKHQKKVNKVHSLELRKW